MRCIVTVALFAASLSLAACGGPENQGNSVQMRDMEVVDGTTSDAMTDLDGVQSESASAATPPANAASNASTSAAAAPSTAPTAPPASADTEVVADQ